MSGSEDEVIDELRRLREELQEDDDLVPTTPEEAYELWEKQLGERSESTKQSYWYRIKPFLQYLERKDIDDLNDLTPRHVKEFEAERQSGTRSQQTLNNQFGTLKQFLSYCSDLEAVSVEVVEAVNVPELTKDERVNTEKLITERAEQILENLERYRYASREHVLFLLLWRTTMRIGAIYSLDLQDLYFDEEDIDRIRTRLREEGGHEAEVVEEILEESEPPFIVPRHRPETGTPLKNGGSGERLINVTEAVAEVIREYVRVNRDDVVDEDGRSPLLTTSRGSGRLTKSAMRNSIYILTQPCEFGAECPHDRDPEACEAREHGHGSKCPSSKSPHKIRTGAITWHRDRRWPIDDLAEKANTSEELISGVYDQPEQLIRGAVRRKHLEKLDESDDTHE